MARPIQPRETFRADIRALSNLAEAIEKDESRPKGWRDQVIEATNNLLVLLIKAPGNGDKETKGEA